MNAFIAQLALVAASLAVAAATVYNGDAGTLVPPPEMVAEEFLKGVVAGRYEPARSRVSEDVRPAIDEQALAELRAALESRLGTVRQVRGRAAEVASGTAVADVELTSASGATREMKVSLVRRHRLWFVASVPGV